MPRDGKRSAIERVAPHNIDAERAVLGSILLSPPALAEARTMLSPEDFYAEPHVEIYAAMLALDAEQKSVDIVTLCARLDNEGKLELVGSFSAIAELTSVVPTSANIAYYAEIVRDHSDKRRLITLSHRAAAAAYNNATSARELIGNLTAELERTTVPQSVRGIQTTKELMPEHETWFKDYIAGNTHKGITTGIPCIDKWVESGIEPDMLITIGARSSDGKSTFLHNLLVNIGITHGPGLLFSLEESAGRVMRRLHRILAPPDDFLQAANRKDLTTRNQLLEKALGKLRDLPVFIDGATRYIEDIHYTAKAHIQRHPETTFVAIDYLQLVRSRDTRLNGRERYDHILDVIAELKASTQRPIIITSQFRKELMPESGPHLSMLKETSRIENDSSIIFLLHAPHRDPKVAADPYQSDGRNRNKPRQQTTKVDPNANEYTLNCNIAKNRDGQTIELTLRWIPKQYLVISTDKRPPKAHEYETQPDLFGGHTRTTAPKSTPQPDPTPYAQVDYDEEPPF